MSTDGRTDDRPAAYKLTFRPERARPDEGPPAPLPNRLRKLLKYALRVLHLRCTQVEKLEAPAEKKGKK
jgi:hypothetical protein